MFEGLLLLSIVISIFSQMLPEVDSNEDEPPRQRAIANDPAYQIPHQHRRKRPCWNFTSRAASKR